MDYLSLDEVETRRGELAKREPDKRSQATRVTDALNETYELIGGVPRMALWAQNPENQTEFYKIWAKTGQKLDVQHSGTINIVPALPPSPLDDDTPPPAIDGDFKEILE